MAWQLNAQLASYLLVMILVLYLILAVLMGLTAPGYVKIRQATDRVVQVTQEGMAGYRVIRSFNQVDGYLTTYDQVNQNLLGHQLKTGFLAALTNPLTSGGSVRIPSTARDTQHIKAHSRGSDAANNLPYD